MKKSGIFLVCTLFAAAGLAQKSSEASSARPQTSSSANAFKDDQEKISYALGMRTALELKLLRRSVEINPDLVVQGLRDSLSGVKTRLTEDERLMVLGQLQRDLRIKEQALKQQMAETNLKEGEAFLVANKTKEGVITLPGGLQYKVPTQGTGLKPLFSDMVVCNYRGTFIDGKEFDSSDKHGGPSTFPVIGVIQGWTQALLQTPVGSKWQLFIPPNLAYGPDGHGRDIEPNRTLIFEVELLSIQPKGEPAN